MIRKLFIQKTTQQAYFSIWAKVPASPADPILGVNQAFKSEKNPNKQLLGVGAYRDDNGKPWILNSVKKANEIIYNQPADNEYLPIEGDGEFIDLSLKLAYGADFAGYKNKTIAGIQTLSGCGGVRMGLELAKKQLPKDITVCIPNPSWPIHQQITQEIGMNASLYKYFDAKTNGLDFQGLKKDLENVPDQSLVLLHVCSHNPTGVDPSQNQWKELKDLFKAKKHIAFFDMAYQGFTSGDITKDSYSLRLFTENQDIPCMLTQSFAKNMGLYGQRIGMLSTLCSNETEKENVMGILKLLARRMYSNPPIQGAKIVKTVLGNPELYKVWEQDIKTMADRIALMRISLKKSILDSGSKKNWDHITNQIGMFAFTGLNKEQVIAMKEKYAIYMTADGRISIAGLNSKNVEYIGKAFHEISK